MARQRRTPGKGIEIGILPVCLSVVTIVLGIVGWAKIDYDGSAHSILKIVFKALGGSRSAGNTAPQHNLWTDAASVGGFLSVYSWFAAIFWKYLRSLAIRLAVRGFYREHIVIIGDTQFARRAAGIWRDQWRRPLHIVAGDDETAEESPRTIEATLDDGLVRRFSLARAAHVIIDLGDDMRSLTLSLDLLNAMSAAGGLTHKVRGKAEWIIVVTDVALADHFAEKVRELGSSGSGALPDLHYLDPRRLAVRHFMATHPLFLIAEAGRQTHVHTLIVGFGAISRHLAEMSLLTSLAGTLALPAVTVLSTNPAADRRRFLSGRPTLAEKIDIAFLEIDGLEDLQLGATPAASALREREDEAPFTLAFLTFDQSQENVRTALLIDDIHRKTGRLGCPLYSYEDDAADASFLTAKTGRLQEIVSGFATFDLPDDVLTSHLCLPAQRDALAKAVHERYAADGASDGWYVLSETLRRSNRNAADHWRAIAHTLGFDIEGPPTLQRTRIDVGDAVRLSDADDYLLQEAARCEHGRWMIERLLEGWSHGEQRDNRRHVHPLLVSWEMLHERFPMEVAKTTEQVRAMIRYMSQHGDATLPLQRRETLGPAETTGLRR